MTDTKHTPGPLTVNEIAFRGKDGNQYTIKSDYSNRPDGVDFIDAYVNISGYYGTYGPHVFAAAPDMLELLEEILIATAYDHGNDQLYKKVERTVAKAKGKTE